MITPSKQRILIVDDDLNVVELVASMLESEGYTTAFATSTRNALDVMEHEDPFDLIILDFGLPDYDGVVACQMIRTLEDPVKAETPVIMCTGVDSLESRKKGFLVGAADFVPKGDFLDELLAAIKRVLQPLDKNQTQYALIVENDRWVRHIIQQALKEASISSLEVVDSESGLGLWRTLKHSIPLAFIGNQPYLPQNLKLLQAIRKDESEGHVPVIAICEHASPASIADFLYAGGSDYINKPFHKEDLTYKIAIHTELRKKHGKN